MQPVHSLPGANMKKACVCGLVIAILGLAGCDSYPVSSDLVENARFPDGGACSLACREVGWKTYTSPSLRISQAGYTPQVGDVIEWKITRIGCGPTSFGGIWYESGSRSVLTLGIAVNGVQRECSSPTWDGDTCDVSLQKPVVVSKGDVIRLEVLGVEGEPAIHSMQPSPGG